MSKDKEGRQQDGQLQLESEGKFRSVFEECPDAIFLADAETGLIVDVNQAACELTGMSKEKLVGLHQSQLHPPDTAERYHEIFKQHAEKGTAIAQDVYIRHSSGDLVPVSITSGALEISGKRIIQRVFRDITERKRSEQEIKRRNEELAALNALGRTVAGSLDLGEILDRALDKVLDVMGLDTGTVRLLDAETGKMALAAHRGLGDEYVEGLRTLRPTQEVLKRLMATLEPVLIKDLESYPLPTRIVKEALDKEQIRSLAAVPLKSKGKVMGVVVGMSRQSYDFSTQDVDLLSSIGSQIGIAVENASLYRQERRRLSEMEALRKTTLDITRHSDVPQLLRSIVERAATLVQTRGGSLYLYRPDDEDLEMVVSLYLDKDYTGIRLRLGEGLAGKVALTGEPLVVEDYVNWDGRSKQYEGAPFRGVLGVPLKWGERIVGVLEVTDVEQPRHFAERHLRLLELFGNQAAIVIENARLHEETKRGLEELSAIEEIVDELSSTLDYQKVIRLVLDKAIEATDASVGAIAVPNEERTELFLLAHRGYGIDADADPPWRWDIQQGIVGRVVTTGELSLVQDVTQDTDYAELIPDTRSQLTVPIIREEKVAGAIVLESRQLGGFSNEQAEFVQHLAEHAAVAMENAQLYERLRKSEERYRTYVENVPDAIWETDAQGCFTYWSPQIEKLTGYSPQHLLGHTPYEFLIHPDDVDKFKNELGRMLEEGRERYTLSHRVLLQDGSTLHVELSMRTVRNDAGDVVKYRGVARDVSERVRLQAELIQSAKLSGIGQMISGVAHELNNPLTTVMGYAQLLRTTDVDEDVKEDLQRIYHDALRAQRIVQNLLTFSRQKKPQRSLVDVNELIEGTLRLRRYQLKVDNVKVVTEFAESLPWTTADSYQLQQVFLNIINNAHQAMTQRKEGGALTVRTELVDTDTIRITFADTGPGIPPAILDKIFDPFFTTKQIGAGTGLGLSVSHGIVEQHGGRIWAESEPGQGATFCIHLPVRSWVEDITLPSADHEPHPMPPVTKRILAIDDEPSVVDLLVRVLQDTGYHVDGVGSAEVALEKLRQERYDLIISDIKMPGMDGPACEQQVRAKDAALAERIVFITGDVLSPSTQAFLERWEGRSIKKPFDVEELKAVVRESLS